MKEFHKHNNSIHPRIQTELRISNSSIEFLDVQTTIKDRFIKTELFTRETDAHQYLHAHSSHPSSVKNAIPYGLGVRVRRICSEESDYSKERGEIKKHIRRRGYDKNTIEEQIKKVDNLKREDLLCYHKKKKIKFNFSRALPNEPRILRKNMKTLHESPRMKQILLEPPLVSFKNRDKILKIYLCTRNTTPCSTEKKMAIKSLAKIVPYARKL